MYIFVTMASSWLGDISEMFALLPIRVTIDRCVSVHCLQIDR